MDREQVKAWLFLGLLFGLWLGLIVHMGWDGWSTR